MTNLSELLPSGGGAKEFSAVASGTLPSGQTVALKANGTVEAVGISPAGLGTEASLSFGGNQGPSVCKLTDTTFVMTGRDSSNSNQATYVIGTVSNGSITFGSKALIGSIGSTVEHLQAFPLTTDKFVVIYKDSSDGNKGKALVGEVSGGSASFGSVVTFETGQTSLNNVKAGVALSSTKFIIAFEDASNSSYAKTIICDVSGTTITLGTASTYNTSNSSKYGVVDKLSSTTVIIAFSETPQSERGRALVGTYSGTSISYGSQVTYDTASVVSHSIVAMSETQVVVSYLDKGFLNYGKSIVLAVSGTTITVGATTDFNIQCKNYVPDSVKLNATQFLVAFSPDQTPNTQRELRIGTISSGTITFATAVEFHNGDSNSTTYLALLGTRDVILSYDTATVFAARDYQLESTNVSDFIGITSEAIANTATGKVNPQGGVATSSTVTSTSSVGTENVYETAYAYYNASTFDSTNNRVVIAYADQGNGMYGTAVVGTINGSTISFGTPQAFTTASITNVVYNPAITFDSNAGKVIIGYSDGANNNYWTCRVATVDPSNNTLTFGTAAVVEPATPANYMSLGFDTNSNKFLVIYGDGNNSNYITGRVGTISGTNITFGTKNAVINGTGSFNSVAFDSNVNKFAVFYRNPNSPFDGKCKVATISGTNVTYGSEATYNSSRSNDPQSTFDSNSNKIVVAFEDQDNNNYVTAAVGTISGTNITFGSTSVIYNGVVQNSWQHSIVFDSTTNKIVHFSRNGINGDVGTINVGTVSGTGISFVADGGFNNSVEVNSVTASYDPTSQTIALAYADAGNSNYGTGVVYTPTGISQPFVIGSTYYVQNDGTLTTTSSTVTAGKAISTTQLILNGAS